jgi:hypothetical protein
VQHNRGFTIVEAAIALALTALVGVSASMALAASRRAAVHAREETIGRAAAHARLSALIERPDADTPPDALWWDRAGCVDWLDAAGRPAGAASDAAYVRRWTVTRQESGAGVAAVIAVLVAPMATAARVAAGPAPASLADQPGVVVLRGVRAGGGA